MAASLKKKPASTTRTRQSRSTTNTKNIATKGNKKLKGALTLKGLAAEKAREAEEAAARAKKVRSSTAPLAPAEHQAKFVDAYQSSMDINPEAPKAALPKPDSNRAANAGRKKKEPKPPRKKYSEAEGFFPDDYDGYFNQNGNSVDEGLFAQKRNDGFLTPEQIADIIELERISKNE